MTFLSVGKVEVTNLSIQDIEINDLIGNHHTVGNTNLNSEQLPSFFKTEENFSPKELLLLSHPNIKEETREYFTNSELETETLKVAAITIVKSEFPTSSLNDQSNNKLPGTFEIKQEKEIDSVPCQSMFETDSNGKYGTNCCLTDEAIEEKSPLLTLKTEFPSTLNDQLDNKVSVNFEVKPETTQNVSDLCKLCQSWFKTDSLLQNHLCRHVHPVPLISKVYSLTIINPEKLSAQSSIQEKKSFSCHLCDLFFSRSLLLKRHLSSHQDTETEHSIEPIVQEFCCDRCTSRFSSKSALRRHSQTHDREAFECHFCHKIFTRKGNYQSHLHTHDPHNLLEPPKSALKTQLHLETDNGDETFKCSHCQKTFTQKGNYQAHLCMHDGYKPFRCPKCAKSFAVKSYLDQHLPTHLKQKPHHCPKCRKGFPLKRSLRMHLLTHVLIENRTYACHQCDMKFIKNYELKTHLQAHAGIKPHGCEECGMRFTHKSSLTRHLKIHTGIKSHTCPVCKKKFSRKEYLNDHMKSFHKNKTG